VTTAERVFAVTPGAAQIASSKPGEDTGKPGKRRFTLYRFVDFDEKHEKKKCVSRKAFQEKAFQEKRFNIGPTFDHGYTHSEILPLIIRHF
jgi:hypothetical protein